MYYHDSTRKMRPLLSQEHVLPLLWGLLHPQDPCVAKGFGQLFSLVFQGIVSCVDSASEKRSSSLVSLAWLDEGTVGRSS
jgi:hypothetical protein